MSISINESDSVVLFKRVHAYLLDKHRFTHSNMTRVTLANAVHTNEKYLVQAVRVFSGGLTLGQFIERLRMEYAKKMLKEKTYLTVDDIAAASGIKSRSTFYRLFRKHYGCSPCEYQQKTY